MHLDIILDVLVDIRSLLNAQGSQDLKPGVGQSLSEDYQDHSYSEYEGNDPGVAYPP